MNLLPVALNLRGRRCLVVGGGPVAARKAKSLLECEAEVVVIAPQLCDQFDQLLPDLEYSARPFQPGDGVGGALIFACTDQPEVNTAVVAEANDLGVWVNRVDEAEQSDFHSMATVRRGGICIGISSSGGSPALTRHLREEIAQSIGPEYSVLLEILESRRAAVKTDISHQTSRAALWRELLQSDVLDVLRSGRRDKAEQLVNELIGS